MHPLLNLFNDFARKRGLTDDTYIVGGAVRDMLSGIETNDIDLAVAGDALKISKEFAEVSGASYVLLDSEFRMARVVKDSFFLDISAMNGESITADLARRDITINAMAQPLREWPSTVHIIDPFGGLQDLHSGNIRMVSEKNLVKDPLRILRICRFSAALHAPIERNTRRALTGHAMLLKNVAVERIAEELRHIMALGDSHKIMYDMEEDNILSVLFPEFINIPVISIKHGIECYRQCESMLGGPRRYFPLHEKHIHAYFGLPGRRMCLKLAALFSGEAQAQEAALRMKMSNKETGLVASIVTGCKSIMPICSAGAEKSEMVRLLKDARDNIYPMAILASALYQVSSSQRLPASESRVLNFSNKILSLYTDEVLPRMGLLRMITGDDLISEFGLSPSPQFKRLLSKLEDDILEGKVKTREEALRAVRDILARGFSPTA